MSNEDGQTNRKVLEFFRSTFPCPSELQCVFETTLCVDHDFHPGMLMAFRSPTQTVDLHSKNILSMLFPRPSTYRSSGRYVNKMRNHIQWNRTTHKSILIHLWMVRQLSHSHECSEFDPKKTLECSWITRLDWGLYMAICIYNKLHYLHCWD